MILELRRRAAVSKSIIRKGIKPKYPENPRSTQKYEKYTFTNKELVFTQNIFSFFVCLVNRNHEKWSKLP